MARKSKEEKENEEVKFHPSIRCYLSVTTPDGNQLMVEEFLELVGQQSISDYVTDLIEKGMLNVYFCEFNRVERVM